MDKSVLLVLLCLQVFLLITAFTSTDAAAVERDDQLPPDQVERRIGNRRKRYFQAGSYSGGTGLAMKTVPQGLPGPYPPRHDGYFMCGYYAGGCVIGQASKPSPPPPPPPPRPDTQA
ncbi:semaphorin-4G-like isoform X12 [Epinephelus fuscoguttatus]|uniref:semaphorin-4G-like isoform X11 n=1 Tax=Epinephelus fuscoguttatus TaxID=293821 RepID=UPI0020D1D0F1|nr:semaphorin-4G-like isoform X11 [Epinephelus fuscoguttatus]XP_049454866.1 semaphorin-4G-like isoform X12 [Epinephelus fuscoguttatus]